MDMLRVPAPSERLSEEGTVTMSQLHKEPAIGKNCRARSAEFAGRRGARSDPERRPRSSSRLSLFAQFPPAALFKASRQSFSRQLPQRPVASGTAIAN